MYKQEKLPFSYEDLEPFIDTHTIGLHYNKHELGYLNNLNKVLDKYSFNYDLKELYNHLDKIDKSDLNDLIFNLGGVTNHRLYWKSIDPHMREDAIGDLNMALNKRFGSLDNFWSYFKNLVMDLKGSGYVFLVQDKDNIDLITTSNQDSPYLYGLIPLLCLDLWEHAYYINYENDKLKYFENFKLIVNFRYANNIYNKKT